MWGVVSLDAGGTAINERDYRAESPERARVLAIMDMDRCMHVVSRLESLSDREYFTVMKYLLEPYATSFCMTDTTKRSVFVQEYHRFAIAQHLGMSCEYSQV